jgi:thioesterase domain-containing protein/acyl carrier protein
MKRDTNEIVLEIWKDILGKEEINADDDFYVLGGDSIKLAELHSEFYYRFDLDIPFNELFQNLNFKKCVALIENKIKVNPKQQKNLVLIKKGDSTLEPFFFCHTPSGDAISYYELAQELKINRDVYVITFNLNDSKWSQPILWDKVIETYVDEIMMLQPKGLIYLAGLSFGGSLALELAYQLQLRNRNIGLCGLMDTVFRPSQRKGLVLKRSMKQYIIDIKGQKMVNILEITQKKLFSLLNQTLFKNYNLKKMRKTIEDKFAKNLWNFTSEEIAFVIKNIQPKIEKRSFYPFDIVYFLALKNDNFESFKIIQAKVKNLIQIDIDCEHGDFLKSHKTETAVYFSKLLA